MMKRYSRFSMHEILSGNTQNPIIFLGCYYTAYDVTKSCARFSRLWV